MRLKNKFVHLVFAVLSIGIASNVFADVNINAQHNIVSSTNTQNGSETVVTLVLSNNGSANLYSIKVNAADNNLTQDPASPLLEISQLDSGSTTSLSLTLTSKVDSSYFENALLLIDIKALDEQGMLVTSSVASEQGVL